MLKTCGFCGATYRRLDRHLAARRGCGLAAKAATAAAVQAAAQNMPAAASGAPLPDADRPWPPTPPGRLGDAGAALWRSVTATFRLDQHELQVLLAACVESDMAAAADLAVQEAGPWLTNPTSGLLRAHPALAAGRASRLASAKLVHMLAYAKDE
jgi:hypothetical protein